jgi:hypothetical protein
MDALRRSGLIAVGLLAFGWLAAGPALACSPPFEKPTIAALGPNQMVFVGTTGDPGPGGRLFHVERSFNVDSNVTPIVIAFKEGEPVGDCSYPVSAGTHLIIAPNLEPDGHLSADLATLQADPNSEAGRRYLAEARSLFGDGLVPIASATIDLPGDPLPPIGLLVGIAVVAIVAVVAVTAWWRRRSNDRP